MGLTRQVKNRENPTEQSKRLKQEAHDTIDRLWAWAESGKVFGEVAIKSHFENGCALRLYASPTEMKI